MLNSKIFRKLQHFFSFFSGGGNEPRRRRILRYSSYVFIVVLLNIMLGKNIGSLHYEWYANVSVFLLLNINILLVLLLCIVIFRNIAKIMADNSKKLFGSKLQTKLIVFSFILIILPVFSTYFVASNIISEGMDRWFENNLYTYSERYFNVAQNEVDFRLDKLEEQGESLASSYNSTTNFLVEFNRQVSDYVNSGFIDYIYVYEKSSKKNYFSSNDSDYQLVLDIIFSQNFQKKVVGLKKDGASTYMWKYLLLQDNNEELGYMLLLVKISDNFVFDIAKIKESIDFFRQLRYYAPPIKKSFKATLLIVEMLIVFACIWGGIILSRGIVLPLKELGLALARISRGDFVIKLNDKGNDEIALIAKTFNKMATKLKEHTQALESKNSELNTALATIYSDKKNIDTIYQNVSSALILFDRDLNIIKANERASGLLLQASETKAMIIEKIQKFFLSSADIEVIEQLELLHKGEAKLFSVRMTKIFSIDKLPDNILLVLDDNTAIINLQRINLWKEVATRIGHEIKNPLTPIRLTAERVNRKSKELSDKSTKDFISNSMNMIINEVDELITLVDDFNTYGKVPSNIREIVNIRDVAQEVYNLYVNSLNITLLFEVEDAFILGDKYQLKRVLSNLVQNSTHALENLENGKICIKGGLKDSSVYISVYDNGEGVPEEELPILFVPYFSKKPNGTGLGLAIVKKIVEEHGGTVHVYSEINKYTQFIVYFPIIKEG